MSESATICYCDFDVRIDAPPSFQQFLAVAAFHARALSPTRPGLWHRRREVPPACEPRRLWRRTNNRAPRQNARPTQTHFVQQDRRHRPPFDRPYRSGQTPPYGDSLGFLVSLSQTSAPHGSFPAEQPKAMGIARRRGLNPSYAHRPRQKECASLRPELPASGLPVSQSPVQDLRFPTHSASPCPIGTI